MNESIKKSSGSQDISAALGKKKNGGSSGYW